MNQLLDATYQDTLGGTFALGSVTHFSLSGFGAFSDLAGGTSDTGFSITFDPSAQGNGTFSDTLVLNPTSTNASGTSPLGGIQLTIQATVVPEPEVYALLLLAGVMLCLRGKRSGLSARARGENHG